MKYIKLKSLIISSLACLIPVVPGLIFWHRLPKMMAVHFNMYNEPDNFVGKGFAVIGIPLFIMMVQIFCTIISDMEFGKQKRRMNFEGISRFVLPVMIIILQTAIIWYNLGYSVDIRRVAGFIAGGMFVALGIFVFKQDYVKSFKLNKEKAKKFNRITGIISIILGLLFIGSTFLPPIATIICLFLIILYSLIMSISGIIISRNKD